MSLFVIGDLHLSQSENKPMDVFGGRWEGYTEKLIKGWKSVVSQGDSVVLAGDISWGMSLEKSLADFQLIDSLPGWKYIIKGNHDYFWTTVGGMRKFFAKHGLTTLDFIHNDFKLLEGIAVCGTKGWSAEEGKPSEVPENAKIFRRELMRMEASLKAAEASGYREKTVVMHYPPIDRLNGACDEIIELFERHGVTRCFYGHLHGAGINSAFEGEKNGVLFRLISADALNFVPMKIV